MNKKSAELSLLTERQRAVFAAPVRESELQTTQHTTPPIAYDSTHYTTYCIRLNTLHHLLQTTQHTTPPTTHREIIIYSKVVEDFKHFATETSVALLLRSASKWL
jgi:hypothetical protein